MPTLRTRLIAIVLAALSFAAAALPQSRNSRRENLRAVAAVELAFSQAAATKGTREAFLEFLADDAVIFQPGPVNGKEFWRGREPRKGLLSWHPAYVDVSAAGDLGYTTGPFEFRPNGPADNPVAFGQYFTIWKKQKDGSWKAVLDRGISYPKAPLVSEDLTFAPPAGPGRVTGDAARAAILKAESDFVIAVARRGLQKAAESFFSKEVRVLRDNSYPQLEKRSAIAFAAQAIKNLSWTPTTGDVSMSGDLGYTYGAYEAERVTGAIERGVYVRMWKCQSSGEFRVVVDIQVPTASN